VGGEPELIEYLSEVNSTQENVGINLLIQFQLKPIFILGKESLATNLNKQAICNRSN